MPIVANLEKYRVAAETSGIRAWLEARSRLTESGCREWQYAVAPTGYGIATRHRGSALLAHRLAYWVYVAQIPEGDWTVDHMCKNRRCIEPKHLRLLSRGDNARDGSRISGGVCKRGHSLADAHLYTDKLGSTHRSCRTCRIETNERAMQRRYPNRVPRGPRLPHTIAAAARRGAA